jgi:tripartite-type tricarboxylate transporter receptor subunit TctC
MTETNMKPIHSRRALLAAAVAAATLAVPPALAQVTEKVVRFVLPNATGSGVDAITRAAQPALAKALGPVVENQPGAGVLGLQTLAFCTGWSDAERGVQQRGDLPERHQAVAV